MRAGVRCYIELSGLSTSLYLFAQDSILNTTHVTVSTTAHPERTIKQG
jgi:hypothetical protein